MDRGRFRHIVELSLLKAVRPDLLVAVLRPFAAELGAAGFQLSENPSPDWLAQLSAMLNREGATLPASLQGALVDIAELATSAGHDEIMTLAEERRIDIVSGGEPIPREDLAFLVYLEQRELFRAARARIKAFEGRLFVDYYGRHGGVPIAHDEPATRMAVLRHRLISWMRKRNRSGTCDARADDLHEQIAFSIVHGAAPTRSPEVRRDVAQHGRVPEQHDIVIFDKRENRLSVSAQLPTERELYRAVFGFVLFLDEDHFRVVRLYHSRPFRERGSRALDATDIEGLEHVSLKRLSFRSTDRRHSKMEVTSEDLREWLDKRKTRVLLHQRPIGSWTLGFHVRHDSDALDVDVLPPNQLRFDRRLPSDLVHRFLQARGFEHRSGDSDDPPSSR